MDKFCWKCKLERPIECFAKDKSRKDGLNSRCRSCQKGQWERFYDENKGTLSSKRKPAKKTEKWRAKMRRAARRRYEKFPKQIKAKRSVQTAIENGTLVRGECEWSSGECNGRIEGHHCDYNKPLEVMWLCIFHHKKWHKEQIPIY